MGPASTIAHRVSRFAEPHLPVALVLMMVVGCSLTTDLDGLATSNGGVADAGDSDIDGGRTGDSGGDEGEGGSKSFGAPAVVASLVTNPRGLCVQPSTGDVYWTQYDTDGTGAIRRAAADGSTSVVVYAGKRAPGAIAVDDGNLYWASDDVQYQSIDWAPLPGGTSGPSASFAATGGGLINALGLDDANLYWPFPNGPFSGVKFAPKTTPGFDGFKISLDQPPIAMALDPISHVVAASDVSGTIFYSVGTGPARTFLTLAMGQTPRPRGMAVHGTVIYWANTDGTIWSANPALAMTPQVFAGGQGEIGGLAVDDTRLYWTVRAATGNGTSTPLGEVRSLPETGGGAPIVLAARQSAPTAIAVSTKAVFWLNAGDMDKPNGSMVRVAKCAAGGC